MVPAIFPQEFIVQRLRDAAGRHVLKEGLWFCGASAVLWGQLW